MSTAKQNEKGLPWEDWEDHGGFDDDEALDGIIAPKRPTQFQERPWYYEKKRGNVNKAIVFGIQTSFL